MHNKVNGAFKEQNPWFQIVAFFFAFCLVLYLLDKTHFNSLAPADPMMHQQGLQFLSQNLTTKLTAIFWKVSLITETIQSKRSTLFIWITCSHRNHRTWINSLRTIFLTGFVSVLWKVSGGGGGEGFNLRPCQEQVQTSHLNQTAFTSLPMDRSKCK